ncbi:alpha-protein kinase vwkA isoform X2 [Hydra vulgaris]|uniref:Alpha-protein kinase vwkA isoform X2 n=1 Tax=Hydra vulgaris TaxID=6087 RepID=A0ABM4CGY3_HYDVU
MHELLTAFCHWTWYISGHKYMVCDLQGVYSNGKYILTDPAIHSFDQQFGSTDLGTLGMERVLGNHKCNIICSVLGLDNPMKNEYVQPGQRPTTYSFQVTEEMLLRKANGGKSNYFKFLDPIFE